MSKRKEQPGTLVLATTDIIDEAALFEHVVEIIENRKSRAAAHANQEATLMFWEIGQLINRSILDNERAGYGKKILSELATKLMNIIYLKGRLWRAA